MHIFSDVQYYLPLSLSSQRRAELTTVLDANGAASVSQDRATHIITNSNNFEGWQSIGDDIAVVTDKWVDRSLILGKRQPTQFYSADPAMVFSGVVACAADLGTSDLEVIAAGITAMGGQWRTGLTRDVTHLFSLTPDSIRYETAMHHQTATRMKILLPHWFDDVVKLGYGSLPTTEYEWPDPVMLRPSPLASQTVGDNREKKKSKKVTGEKKSLYESALLFSSPGKGVPIRATRDGEERNIWHGRRVMLSPSLELKGGRREAIEAGIARAGGELVKFQREAGDGDLEEEAEKIEETDVLITRYRSGPAYIKALKSGKTIGTLSWLFHVESTGTVARPTDQLLHFPIPKKPVDNFQHHEITVTNYTGEARDYIKKLISAMGAKFTPSMSARNTVVIAAYYGGNKATKAKNWNIPVVNHTWLEDCFVQWQNLTVGLEKYISFPAGVDFSAVLGDKGVGRVVLDDINLEQEIAKDLNVGQTSAVSEERPGKKVEAHPVGTEVSVMDMREVENAISMEDDPDIMMDVDEAAENVKKGVDGQRRGRAKMDHASEDSGHKGRQGVTRTRKTRVTKVVDFASDEEQRSDVMLVSPKTSRTKGRSSPAKQAMRQPSSDEDDASSDLEEEDSRIPKVDGRLKKSSRQKEGPLSDIGRSGKRRKNDSARSHPESNQPGPSTPKRVVAQSSKGRNKEIFSDTDEEDFPTRLTSKKPLSSSESRGKGKGKAEATSPDSPEPQRRPRSKTTRRQLVSVLVPPLVKSGSTSGSKVNGKGSVSPKKSSVPARPGSVSVEANELPESPRTSRGHMVSSSRTDSKARSSSPEPELSPPPRKRRIADQEHADPDAVQAVSMGRTMSKRSAATKATQQLRDIIMPDVVNFEKEMKKGNVRSVWEGQNAKLKAKDKGQHSVEPKILKDSRKSIGKKRASDVTKDDDSTGAGQKRKKRRISEGADDSDVQSRAQVMESDLDGEDVRNLHTSIPKTVPKAKKRPSNINPSASHLRRSETDPKTVRLMHTQVVLPDEIIKGLLKLGVKMASRPSECTHLIPKALARTEKLLCAIPVSPFILNPKWALDSAAAKVLLPEEDYYLEDPENEDKYNFRLSDALKRAKEIGGRLLAGKTFYVTPKVKIETKLLKNVVVSNGGQLVTQTPTVRTLNGQSNRHVISCPEDISIWRPLANHGIAIYTAELILNGALKQEMDWDAPAHRISASS